MLQAVQHLNTLMYKAHIEGVQAHHIVREIRQSTPLFLHYHGKSAKLYFRRKCYTHICVTLCVYRRNSQAKIYISAAFIRVALPAAQVCKTLSLLVFYT